MKEYGRGNQEFQVGLWCFLIVLLLMVSLLPPEKPLAFFVNYRSEELLGACCEHICREVLFILGVQKSV